MQRILLLLYVFSLFLTGCGGQQKPPGMPKLYPVTISVVQDGKPLPEAVVTLIPEETGNQWSSGGITDAKGKLTLMTYGQFPGVPAGKYKVCISKQELVGEMDYSDPASPKGNRQVFEVVDPVFKSGSTTTLEMEVSPQGKNNVGFDVGKSVRIEAAAPPGTQQSPVFQ